MVSPKVGVNLTGDALLGVGEREGEMVVVEGVEVITDFRERDAREGVLAKGSVSEEVELEEEEFFEFEASLCVVEELGGRREVNVSNGLVTWDELMSVEEVLGEGFVESGDSLEEGADDVLDVTRGEAGFFHGVGGMVEGDEFAGEVGGVSGKVEVRVRDGDGVIELVGLAEEDVLGIGFVLGEDVMDVVKPDEGGGGGLITEGSYEPLVARSADDLEVKDMSP
jgi:hypothetical protein